MQRSCWPRLVLVFACLPLLSCAGARERQTARDYAVALDPVAFERGPGSPWMDAADEMRFGDAAQLVEAYITAHGGRVDASTTRRLHLIAARMHGCDDEHADALRHLEAAAAPRGDRDAPAGWNAFLRASAAFIDRDRGAFEAARSEVVAHAGLLGDLDGFVREVEGLARMWQDPWCLAMRRGDVGNARR
jgi:hypothetical protein